MAGGGSGGEAERGTRAGGGFDPEAAAGFAHDAFADGEAEAAAGEVAAVEAAEGLEDAAEILFVDAEAVVADGEDPVLAFAAGADADFGALFAAVFNGVADEVLKELHEVAGFGHDDGQIGVGDAGAAFADGLAQVGEGFEEGGFAGDGFERAVFAAGHGVSEQVRDEMAHAAGAVDGEAEEFALFAGEFAAPLEVEEFEGGGDGAERLLEVVGGGGSEGLEVFVGAFEVFGGLFELAGALALLLLEAFAFEGGVQAGAEEHGVEGFDEVFVGAEFDAAGGAFDFVEGGDHDDGDARQGRHGADVAKDIDAGHAGHHDVEENEFDGLGLTAAGLEDGEGLGAAFSAESVVAVVAELADQHVAVGGVVVDDEDAGGRQSGMGLGSGRGERGGRGRGGIVVGGFLLHEGQQFAAGAGDAQGVEKGGPGEALDEAAGDADDEAEGFGDIGLEGGYFLAGKAGAARRKPVFDAGEDEAGLGVNGLEFRVRAGRDIFIFEKQTAVAEDVRQRRAQPVPEAGERVFKGGPRRTHGVPRPCRRRAMVSSRRFISTGLVS